MTRPTDKSSAQRQALASLVTTLAADPGGAVLSAAVEILPPALGAAGFVAYRLDGRDLALAAESGLPRRAKPWLARLTLADEPWFVVQRAARSLKLESASGSGARSGHPAEPILEQEGWRHVLAVPLVAAGRQLLGALTIATPDPLGADDRLFLETSARALELALARQLETERRVEERMLEARTAQLATIGLLVSTIGAELSAPLGRIELQLEDQQALLDELRATFGATTPELVELRELTRDVAASLRAMAETTERLASLSEESRLEAVDLTDVVRSASLLLRESLAARDCRLELALPPDPVKIVGRRDSLELVLVQLALRAGRPSSRKSNVDPVVRLSVSVEATGHVLAVESSFAADAAGLGSRSFEALVTGRHGTERGELGLSLARQTVLAHNGHIELGASALGGELIRIVFPTAPAPSRRERAFARRPAAAPTAVTEPDRPLGSVLWVEDDETFLHALRRVLRCYAVHGARTLADAEALLRILPEPPELIFCDLGLEEGKAIELHRKLSPALADRVVFVTGGVIAADAARYIVATGRPTLIKPIAVDEVAGLLALEPAAQSLSPSAAPTLQDSTRPAPPSRR